MSKSSSKQVSKQVPWIPPGTNTTKRTKCVNQQKRVLPSNSNTVDPSSNVPPTLALRGDDNLIDEENKDITADSCSVSELPNNINDEANIYILSICEEKDLLYFHFEALKSMVFSIYRLLNAEQDSFAKKLLFEVEEFIGELNSMFDELEFLITVYENTIDEENRIKEAVKAAQFRKKLLLKLLKMYEKVIYVFQATFRDESLNQISEVESVWKSKLKLIEDRCVSKEAVITDLNRKLSINESKLRTSESYRKTLEETKNELMKQLSQKESRIKYLSNELLETVSEIHKKSDHEDLIDVIEEIKNKSHLETSALKKALKFQKSQATKIEDKLNQVKGELKEKEEMVLEIATQRDQLKIHLTIASNNIIDLKNQIEKLKKEKTALENNLDEDISKHKKEVLGIKNDLDEKCSLLERSFKEKEQLEEKVADLEIKIKALNEENSVLKEKIFEKNSEVQRSINEGNSQTILNEIQNLSELLQNTNKEIEVFKTHTHVVSASGDSMGESTYVNIIGTVKEANENLLELKDLFQKYLFDSTKYLHNSKESNAEQELKRLEDLYQKSIEENKILKLKLEEIENSSMSSSIVQRPENMAASMSNDYARKLQMDLFKKSDEIVKLKCKFQEKEKDFKNQLKETKDQLKSLEASNLKILNLEKDLHAKEIELSMLRQQKNEEADRLLQRIKETQDALDIKVAENERLQNYTQLLKSSYFNVFGAS